MKKLNVTVKCLASYDSSVDVPDDMSLEEAKEYVYSNMVEIELTKLDFIEDLEIEKCSFEKTI